MKSLLLLLQLVCVCVWVLTACCQERTHIFVSSRLSQMNAQAYCQEHHANLSSILSQTDHLKLQNLNHNDGAWIGLRLGPDNWTWTNGSSLTFYNWAPGEGHCAAVSTDRLMKQDCHKKLPFICQNTLSYDTISDSKTWKEAKVYCEAQDHLLATFTNPSSKSDQWPNDPHWVGLSNNPWQWPDGSAADVQYWEANEPNYKADENCVRMQNMQWVDVPCSEQLPFFCLMRPQKRLKVLTEPSSWEEALLHCRGLGGDLASIVDHDNQLLTQQVVMAATTTHVWVGLRFLAGEWLWVSDGHLEYHHWAAGREQEICPLYHCGAVGSSTGLWESRGCEEALHFLCQLP